MLCYLHKFLCLGLSQFFFPFCAFEDVGNAECVQKVHYRLDRVNYSCIIFRNIFLIIRGKDVYILELQQQPDTDKEGCVTYSVHTFNPICLGSGWTKNYQEPLTVFLFTIFLFPWRNLLKVLIKLRTYLSAYLEAVDLTREIGSVHTAVRGTEGSELRGSKRRRE